MYNPIYRLSPKLLTTITQIERLYGQIEALKIPQKLELNLTRHNLVKSSYASNKIEGNPLSEAEVTNLLLADRVPVNRDEKEVVNYFAILKSMSEYKEKQIDLAIILDFHKRLMTGVDDCAGTIRNVPVVIGKYKEEKGDVSLKVKHNPPVHTKEGIEMYLGDLFTWSEVNKTLPVIIRTGIFHHQFVYIHPFEDGNGRVCRLSTALMFIQMGYQINRYFVLDDYYDIDKQQYSDMLHTADNGDKTSWLEYYAEGVMYSLQSALSRMETAMRSLRMEERPTPKEKDMLALFTDHPELTAPEAAEILGVSRQQTHALLRNLVEKGLVEKKGSTKSSYYTIK